MKDTGSWSGEIWRRILNSVAHKCDCGVHFNLLKGRLGYEGAAHCFFSPCSAQRITCASKSISYLRPFRKFIPNNPSY